MSGGTSRMLGVLTAGGASPLTTCCILPWPREPRCVPRFALATSLISRVKALFFSYAGVGIYAMVQLFVLIVELPKSTGVDTTPEIIVPGDSMEGVPPSNLCGSERPRIVHWYSPVKKGGL